MEAPGGLKTWGMLGGVGVIGVAMAVFGLKPAVQSAGDAAETAAAGPPACEAPRQRDCSFYPTCIEANVPCGPSGYALGFGNTYCERFKSTTFSQSGAAWADSVMLCLEKSLVPYAKPDRKSATCDEITKAAFDSHPACYTAPPDSICFLPPPDVLAVFDTIGTNEVFAARTREQIQAVIATCTVQVADVLIDGPRRDAGVPNVHAPGDGVGAGHGIHKNKQLTFWKELAYQYRVPGAKPPHFKVSSPGPTTVSHGLDAAVVQRIVRQGFGSLRACYDSALDDHPTLAGTIGVTFAIEKDGGTSNVGRDATTTVADERLLACVTRAFSTLKFPPPKDGAKVSVSYPIVLDTGDAAPPRSMP